MAKELKPGDKVTWRTSQGETHGTVERKATGTARVKSYTAHADKEHPQYMVKSDKTGSKAVHKPEALKRKD